MKRPTEAQKHAGNYQKKHVHLHGLRVSIENEAGSVRSGKSADGKRWSSRMHNDYGYVRGTQGRDNDHLDVFLGPGARSIDHPVHVIDQVDPQTGKFDEHKAMIGWPDAKSAAEAYHKHYPAGWAGMKAITPMSLSTFKQWAAAPGRRVKPAAEHSVSKFAEGGAVFGHFPQLKKRREQNNDRAGAQDLPVQAARGWAAGTLGLPGDIESIARTLIKAGAAPDSWLDRNVSADSTLPTSEFYKEWLPGHTGNKTSGVGTELGSLFGGVGSTRAAGAALRGAKAAGAGVGAAVDAGMQPGGALARAFPARAAPTAQIPDSLWQKLAPLLQQGADSYGPALQPQLKAHGGSVQPKLTMSDFEQSVYDADVPWAAEGSPLDAQMDKFQLDAENRDRGYGGGGVVKRFMEGGSEAGAEGGGGGGGEGPGEAAEVGGGAEAAAAEAAAEAAGPSVSEAPAGPAPGGNDSGLGAAQSEAAGVASSGASGMGTGAGVAPGGGGNPADAAQTSGIPGSAAAAAAAVGVDPSVANGMNGTAPAGAVAGLIEAGMTPAAATQAAIDAVNVSAEEDSTNSLDLTTSPNTTLPPDPNVPAWAATALDALLGAFGLGLVNLGSRGLTGQSIGSHVVGALNGLPGVPAGSAPSTGDGHGDPAGPNVEPPTPVSPAPGGALATLIGEPGALTPRPRPEPGNPLNQLPFSPVQRSRRPTLAPSTQWDGASGLGALANYRG